RLRRRAALSPEMVSVAPYYCLWASGGGGARAALPALVLIEHSPVPIPQSPRAGARLPEKNGRVFGPERYSRGGQSPGQRPAGLFGRKTGDRKANFLAARDCRPFKAAGP